jgi:hypothetical protein
MIISPLKNAHKPPQVEAFQYGKLSDRQNTRGNSLSLVETEEGQFDLLEFPGQTQGRIVIFGTNTMTTTGADWPYTASDVLTISGCQITANNKTATVVSVSGKTMTFAASTFTPAVETQGSITDGTDVYQITVDPGHPQTLASQTSFDLAVSGKNILSCLLEAGYWSTSTGAKTSSSAHVRSSDYIVAKPNASYAFRGFNLVGGVTFQLLCYDQSKTYLGNVSGGTTITGGRRFTTLPNTAYITFYYSQTAITDSVQIEIGLAVTAYEPYTGVTVTVPLRKASDNSQMTLAGRVLTYKADGSPDTWYGYDQIIKKSDGKWYHRKNGEFHADATTRADFWYLLGTPVDTELSAADQTALTAAEKSFAGTTNIMLSTALGQVRVDQWSKAARR